MYCALSAISRRCQGYLAFLPPGFFFGSSLLMTLQPAAEKLAREITQATLAGAPAQPFQLLWKPSQTNVPDSVEPLVPY